jgi:ketosteroid isomerase-like protein
VPNRLSAPSIESARHFPVTTLDHWQDGLMAAPETLALLDQFTAALNARDLEAAMALVTDDIIFESTSPAPDGARYEGREAVAKVWGEMLASTPGMRFTVEEQFCMGDDRAIVLWRYDWGDGHVRGVDIDRVRDGKLCESFAYVKG